MNMLETVEFDKDGFLIDPQLWTPDLANAIAELEGIVLTDNHWKVINFARAEYDQNGDAPTLRRIKKSTGISTKEMYQLFPKGPAKLAAKIAGLHKPTGCL